MKIDKAISGITEGLSGIHVDRGPCCSSRIARIGELKRPRQVRLRRSDCGRYWIAAVRFYRHNPPLWGTPTTLTWRKSE
jgi:hypothetical protein